MLVRLEAARDGKYKWIAHFANGRKTRFGAVGYDDYTLGATDQQRDSYIARHAKDLRTKDPYRAGFLSRFILWGDSRSMANNVRSYNSKFF
jgi:hypothetical protein